MGSYYRVSWFEWNAGVNQATYTDPVSDSIECSQRFEYPHEAKMFAQAKANEIERQSLGPWYNTQLQEIEADTGREIGEAVQIESRSRRRYVSTADASAMIVPAVTARKVTEAIAAHEKGGPGERKLAKALRS